MACEDYCWAFLPGRLHVNESYSRLCWWLQVFEEDNTGFKRMDERKGQGSDDEGALSLAMGSTVPATQAQCCPVLCWLMTLSHCELLGWPWCVMVLPNQRRDLNHLLT